MNRWYLCVVSCLVLACSSSPVGNIPCGNDGECGSGTVCGPANKCIALQACPSGQSVCGDGPESALRAHECYDLTASVAHCGTCANACPTAPADGVAACKSGQCELGCIEPAMKIGAVCVRPPPAPSDVTAGGGANLVQVGWTATARTEHYEVSRGTVAGGPYTLLGSATVASFSDTTAASGTQYFYVVRAVNAAGKSAASNEATATTAPDAPTATAAALDDTHVDVAWLAVPGAERYSVYRGATQVGTVQATAGATNYVFHDSGLTPATSFSYSVKALDAAGAESSPASAQTGTTTLLSATGSVGVARVDDTSLTVTWNRVSSAASYDVVRSGASTQTLHVADPGSGASVTTTDSGLAPNSSYSYVVTAKGAASLGGVPSSAQGNVTLLARPATPQTVAVDATHINVTVAARIGGATSYKVLRGLSAGALAQVGTITDPGAGALIFNDTGLTPGTVYFYGVTAASGTNNSLSSPSMMWATLCALPAAPTATTIDSTRVDVVLSRSAGADVYSLNRFIGAAAAGSVQVPDPGGALPTFTFHDSGLTPNSSYTYVVTAHDLAGNSPAATSPLAALTLLPTPVPIATATDDTHLSLTWPHVPGATSYVVQRSTVSGQETLLNNQVNDIPGTVVLNEMGLQSVYRYYYRVSAKTNTPVANVSANSVEVAAITAASVPSPLVLSTVDDAHVKLTWTPSPRATGYALFRALRAGTLLQVTTVSGAMTSSFTDSGLTGATAYDYAVAALGAGGALSAKTSTSTITTLLGTPSPVTAAPSGAMQITGTWPHVTAATGYVVTRSPTAAPFPLTVSDTGSGTQVATDNGVTPGTVYSYTVSAVSTGNAGVTSVPSAIASAQLPAAPSLSGLPNSDTVNQLIWNTIAGAAQYQVASSSTAGAENFAAATTVSAAPGATQTFLDSGRSAGTTRFYKVAIFGQGSGFPSNEVSVVSPPAVPANVTAVPLAGSTDTAISVSWTPSPGATSYTVQHLVGGGFVNTVVAAPPFHDTGLTPGTSYPYFVQAVAPSTTSGFSPQVTASTLLLTAPTLNTPMLDAAGNVQLTFSSVPGATSFNVLRGTAHNAETNINGTCFLNACVTNDGAASAIDPTALPRTTYFYQVQPFSASAVGPISNEVSFTPTLGAVTGVNSAAASDPNASPPIPPQVVLNWNPVPGATGYTVKRFLWPPPGSPQTIATVAAPFASYYDTGVADQVQYGYQIIAFDGSGSSAPFTTSTALTPQSNAVVGNWHVAYWDADRWTPSAVTTFNPVPLGGNLSRVVFYLDSNNNWVRVGGAGTDDGHYITQKIPVLDGNSQPLRHYVRAYGNTIFVDTTGRVVDTRREFIQRPSLTSLSFNNLTGMYSSTPLDFNLTWPGSAAFNSFKTGDDLEAWSVASGYHDRLSTFGGTLAPLTNNVTTTAGFGEDMALVSAGIIDSTQGDSLWLAHKAGAVSSTGRPYVSIANVYTPPSFTLVEAQTNIVAGTFTPVVRNATFEMDFKRSQFHALLDPVMPPGAVRAGDQIFVEAEPLGGTRGHEVGKLVQAFSLVPSIASVPQLVTMNLDTGTYDVATGPLPYANPYGATYAVAAGVRVSWVYNYTLPADPTNAVYPTTASIIQYRQLPDILEAGGAVTPHIAPPSAVKINGSDASVQLMAVGTTPTISWTASSHQPDPDPTNYEVEIFDLLAGNSLVTTLATKSTSLRVPTSLLGLNGWYYLRVSANYEPGRDVTVTPDTNAAQYSYRAEVLTAKFQP